MSKDVNTTYEFTPSLFGTIKLGIRAIAGEIHWNIIRFLRQWEIKELKARLDRQYMEFGRLIYRDKDIGEEEKKRLDSLREEIGSLEEEISYLEQEIEELRTRMIKERQERVIV